MKSKAGDCVKTKKETVIMDINNMLKKYRSKLTIEAVLRSAIFGSVFGFAGLLIFEFIDWMTDYKAVWVGAIVFVVIAAVAGALSFFLKYRTSVKKVAKRIDELGLEERVLTMAQFRNEESEIYKIQREETVRTLKANGITEKLIKIAISVPCIICLIVTAAFGIGMTTVSALSANGIIGDGSEVIGGKDDDKVKKQFEVYYEVLSGEGYIDGEIFQVVEEGSSASPVIAIPEDGFAFVKWSDGFDNPYRLDSYIISNVTYYAVFMPISELDGNGDTPSDGDVPEVLPTDYKEGGEGEESDSGKPSPGAGGVYEDHNQVFDGETYYGGQVYKNAYEEAIERMAKEQGWTEEEKELIYEYFKTIAK